MSDVNTENKILAAARKIFLEKGKTGTRMQDIAGELGINKALLHYYFRSKDRLYQKVVQGVIGEFIGFFADAAQLEQPFQQVLRSFIDHYY